MEATAQVLVVGAGPVGLMTALHLKRRGIQVRVVDQVEPESARSFAVTLHPRTVEMLAEFGLVEPLRWQGHSFERIALFTDGERRALLTLPVDGEFAEGGLTVPQDVLRAGLESMLRSADVPVEYGLKFSGLQQHSTQVHSRLLKSRGGASEHEKSAPATGELDVVSEFVIGADGFQSSVRNCLGIALRKVGRERPFAFFDVPHPPPAGPTAEFALVPHPSAMYPLRDGRTRYCFELPALPERPLGVLELDQLLRARMPWHSFRLHDVEWSAVRAFQPALAERIGRDRVWLVGDACHVANPLGAQSLNVGLREARDLAEAIADTLHGRELAHLAQGYGGQRQLEWRRLLALGEKPSFSPRTPPWAIQHFELLLSSLPASRDDLDDLLEQLGITVL